MFCELSLCLTKRLNMEKSEQFLVQFLNNHPDRATIDRVEAKAAQLYPTGCIVVFGHDGVYAEPFNHNAGNSMVISYHCHSWISVKSVDLVWYDYWRMPVAELRDLINQKAEPLIKRSIEYMNDLFSNDNLI